MSTGWSTKVAIKRKWILAVLLAFGISIGLLYTYVKLNPLVFSESFYGHAHCIPQAAGAFLFYAQDNFGRFPFHTNGYGDALLLLYPTYASWSLLTGPGNYKPDAGATWKQSGVDVPESECGRVYVQGLMESNYPGIAILFDKVPTPGGDHCHLLKRLTAPLCRDVLLLDGSREVILESDWPAFASNQIELLVKDGFDRATAEKLYAEKGRVR